MKIRVADYIIKFLEEKGVEKIFLVTGGGAMFLNDAVAKSKKIQGVFNLHEQASAMSALGYSKLYNDVGVVMPTTGCGGTNTITGLLDAWQDSNKLLFISGNVKSKETTHGKELSIRKLGVQEANIIDIVKSITKYSHMVTSPESIKFHLQKAFYEMNNNRPGPVWLDIPMDIQSAYVNEKDLLEFEQSDLNPTVSFDDLNKLEGLINNSKRPIVVAGYGIHLSNCRENFKSFILKYNLPVVFTYLGIDLLDFDSNYYVGRLGSKGDRAGNFAIQNSDLVLSLGSSLSVPVIGHQYEYFAREAKIVTVDIDPNEHKKGLIKVDLEIHSDLKTFFNNFNSLNIKNTSINNWREKCIGWKKKWPVFNQSYFNTDNGINMYLIIEKISELMHSNSVVVSDAGSAYYVSSQGTKLNKQQRYITSGAQADMGFTLPCSIGIALRDSKRPVIGITGDGSVQMNIQEFQTLKNYNLNVKIFVLNNNGYLSIRNTMDKFFDGRYLGVGPESGLKLPSLSRISNAYELKYFLLSNLEDINNNLKDILEIEGPVVIEVMNPIKQDIIPSSASKENSDGVLESQPLENMTPFLSENEYENEMIIKII